MTFRTNVGTDFPEDFYLEYIFRFQFLLHDSWKCSCFKVWWVVKCMSHICVRARRIYIYLRAEVLSLHSPHKPSNFYTYGCVYQVAVICLM
jgi:hypothetical protein